MTAAWGARTIRLLTAGGMALGVQAVRTARRGYLPRDPGFRIDTVVGPAGAPVRLAVIGDSTVAGVGSPTALEALPALVAAEVAVRLDRPVRVVGHGVAAARTHDVLAQVPAIDPDADAVLVVAGANDVTRATPPWLVGRATATLLAAVRRQAPRAAVTLVGAPRFAGVPAFSWSLGRVADALAMAVRAAQRRACTRHDVAFVDLADGGYEPFRCRPEALSADGYHPSPVGYRYWADVIAPVVAAGLAGGAQEAPEEPITYGRAAADTAVSVVSNRTGAVAVTPPRPDGSGIRTAAGEGERASQ